jgi:cytochrome c peroxidase
MRVCILVLVYVPAIAFERTTPLGLDLYMPVPDDNPITQPKIALGRRLFHDRRLSRDGTVSCATCHQPRRAFSDGRSVSVGVHRTLGLRNASSLVNRGYSEALFWDGRALSLEQQASEPLLSTREMGATSEGIVAYLAGSDDYRRRFQAAFGRSPALSDVARALASYVRTIRSGNSRFDRFAGGDVTALNAQERAGLALFRGRASCASCHAGPTLTDDRFHNTGVAFRDGRFTDEGRYRTTHVSGDIGAFRTPGLRDVARTAPYMHDGSLRTLQAVVEYYSRGGNRNPHLDSAIRPLNLTIREKASLAAFLRSLTGRISEGK